MSFGGTMNRPGTGMRPGSGQARGSSYGGGVQQPAMGVGMSLNQNVEVTARPAVMREGMKGMAPSRAGVPGTAGGLGPGRQVVNDRSYFIGLLRPKVAELTAEIERLKGEEEKINRNSAMLGQLQQKHRSLADEIAHKKANMADVNFAVEKMATQDAETISQQATTMHQQNAEQRRAVDKMFLSVKEVETQIRNQMATLDQELQSLEGSLRNDSDFGMYKRTRDDAYSVSDQVLQQQHEIRTLIARQEFLMGSLSQDADKKRAASYLLEILKKRQLREELTKECSVSIEDERQALIRQAKTTAQDIDVLQRQVVEAKDAIQESKNRIASANEDMNEYSGDNAQKFQELQDKDREMQEFMDTFPANEKEELSKITEVESSIVELLERISRAHTIKSQMPQENTPQMLDQMANELGEKESQYQNAKLTHQRLERELQERKDELSKVSSLDEKINTELQTISQRMQEQTDDISRYSDIDGLRQQIDQRKKHLTARKGALLKQRDNSKQQVHFITTEFESKKQKLNENDVHTSLASQEQKLRLIWQSAFALEDFVRMKEKETQYNNIKADCMRITDECNAVLRDPRRFDSSAQQQGNVMILGAQ